MYCNKNNNNSCYGHIAIPTRVPVGTRVRTHVMYTHVLLIHCVLQYYCNVLEYSGAREYGTVRTRVLFNTFTCIMGTGVPVYSSTRRKHAIEYSSIAIPAGMAILIPVFAIMKRWKRVFRGIEYGWSNNYATIPPIHLYFVFYLPGQHALDLHVCIMYMYLGSNAIIANIIIILLFFNFNLF